MSAIDVLRARLATNAMIRTVLQGLVVVAAVAGWAAARDAIGADGPIDYRAVLRVAIQAGVMAIIAYGIRFARTGRIEPVSWRIDAWVRTGRTLVTGLAVTAAVAVYQAVEAMADDQIFDGRAVTKAALTAAGMAVTAYVHRLVDQTRMPTATPPPVAAGPV
jgi:hypothetical protein